MSNVDVELLYGVSGGGDLSGASGREISKSLNKLVKALEKAKVPTIKIFFDEKDLTSKLKRIKDRIAKELGGVSKIKINTLLNKTVKTSDSTKQSKEELELVKKQQEAYKILQDQIKKVDAQQREFYRSKQSDSEYYQSLAKSETEGIKQLEAAIQSANLTEQQRAELSNQVAAIQIKNQTALNNSVESASFSYSKIANKVSDYIQRMEKQGLATKEARAELEKLKILLRTPLNISGDSATQLQAYKKATQELQKEYAKVSTYISESGASDPTVFGNFTKALQNKFQSMLSAMLIASAGRALRQIYQHVYDIDTALTQLNITCNLSEKQMTSFMNNAAASAAKLGLRIDDLVESVTEFVRLGYSLEDSSIFAELTAMYSNVTGVTVAEATTNMTAIIKAFDVSAQQAESVLDKLIEVGNNYAISPGELGEAMNNAASALAANGNSLEEAMGILTAANVTLQNVNKSSTAVRTIAARISASTMELENLGEDSTSVISTASLDRQMRGIGVSITDVNGNLRSTFDILNDLSKVWDDLQSTERAAVAEMLAGTRQQNAFYSIMDNWSDATGAVQDCDEAMGTLKESYDIYLDSIQGKLGQLTATWQSVSNTILESEIVKVFVDIMRGLASGINRALNAFGGFGKNVAIVIASISLLTVAIAVFKTRFVRYTTEIGLSLKKVFMSSRTYITIILSWLISLMSSGKETQAIIVGAITLITITVLLCLKKINTAINAFMTSNFIGWIILAITAVITIIKSLIDMFKKPSYKELKEAAEEAKEAWGDAREEVESVNEELDKVSERIKEINSQQSISLVDKEELEYLKKYEAELKRQADLAADIAETKERDAAKAAMKAIRAYENKSTYKKPGKGERILKGIVTFGISEWYYEETQDNAETQREKLNRIFEDWDTPLHATTDEAYVQNYLNEINGLLEDFTYYTGDDLESWQRDINSYFDSYWETLDKYQILNGRIEDTWNAIFTRPKYEKATEALTDLAEEWNVSEQTLRELASSNGDVKKFLEYLQQLGIFAWNDADSIAALVTQIRDLATVSGRISKDYMGILESITDKYDTLKDAMDSFDKNGILDSDTISDVMEKFPEWTTGVSNLEENIASLRQELDKARESGDENLISDLSDDLKEAEKDLEQLKSSIGIEMSDDGYILSEGAIDKYIQYIRNQYVEALAEAEAQKAIINEGLANPEQIEQADEAVRIAKENLANFETVINTIIKPSLLEDYVEQLEKQNDVLDEQLDKFKDMVSIRQDLLETYKDELDYQKDLASKQKSVADLQTKLKLARLDTSASGQARVRELESELEDAQEDLDEFTLEKAIEQLTNDLETEADEYEDFINRQIETITESIENAAKLTVDALSKLQSGEDVPSHHTGGFVMGAKLKDNEEFAKLLQGEFVATPGQMSRFMNKTLPSMTNQSGGNIVYNSPLIEIKCDSVDSESLPKLQKVIDRAVKKVKAEIDDAFRRTGRKGSIDKFTM